jgi:hypothetical protein
MTNAEPTIDAARTALARGDRAGAKQFLLPIVRSSAAQTSGEVWWLLGQTLDDAAQQADCLQRASALGYTPAPAAQETPPELPVFPWDMPDEPAPAPTAEPAHTYSATPPPRKRRSAPASPAARATAKPQIAPPPASPYAEADIAFVIAEFGRHEHRYEIIQKVMQRRDCVFADAEALVDYVEANHDTVIAKKQLPLIMVLSVAAIIGGVYVAYSAFDVITDGPLLLNSFSPRDYIRLGGGIATAFGGLVGLIQGLRRLRK